MMPRLAESRARVGIADESIELSNAARAIEMLLPVVRARSAEPYGILARAELSLGDAYALAGNLGEALDAYTRAQDDAPRDDPDGVRDRARAGLSRVRSAR
jgi:predicted Zn-dependent protease